VTAIQRRRQLFAAAAGTAAETAETFRPIKVMAVEITRPLSAIDPGLATNGTHYFAALILVRLSGEPLGLAIVPLRNGEATAEEAAERVWDAVQEEVRARIGTGAGHEGPAALLAGLTSRPSGERDGGRLDPYVTVIVPTGGRGAQLDRCLSSLRNQDYPDFDVLVVDNRPDDQSTHGVFEAHSANDPRIRYSAEPRPGSSVARNHGIMRTEADIVAFTDDDVVVDPLWLRWLVAPFLEDPGVGVVTGLVLPAELETRAQLWFELYYGGFGKGFERRVYDLDRHTAFDRLFYPYWGGVFGSGNSMAFRRSSLCAIGGFDPALGAGSVARAGSDIEAFSHLILRGERLVYEPRSICWHQHRRDEASFRRQLTSYGVGFTAILTKWALRRPSLLISLLRAFPMLLRETLAGKGDHDPNTVLPRELRLLELRGYMLGPILYFRSMLWARRLRLTEVMRACDPVSTESGQSAED